MKVPTKNLKNGSKIPVIGQGTWQLKGKTAENAVLDAIDLGYRHIDTADRYGNHKEVGRAIKTTGVNRDEIFLTTKVWYTDLDYDTTIKAVERFLNELQVDYIDLLLVHWPNSSIPLEETLQAFKELQEDKSVLNVGVSNFTINHLKLLEKVNLEKGFNLDIVNSQFEIHPSFYQPELIDYCFANDMLVTAYSPLGSGEDLKLKELYTLSEKYKRPESEIILAWLRQKGLITIPKATSRDYLESNLNSLSLELDSEDIKTIDSLNTNNRVINPGFAEFDL